MRSKFLMRCMKWGMRERAVEVWEKLHVQTEAAIVMWFTLSLVSIVLYAYLLVAGTPRGGMYTYIFRAPLCVCCLQQSFNSCGVWRYGQSFMDTFVFKIAVPPTVFCFICFMVVGCLCPKESVPFGSFLHFIAVLALLICSLTYAVTLLPVVIPAERFRGLLAPAVASLMASLRQVDACTDLSFLRVLADQVCFPATLLFVLSMLRHRNYANCTLPAVVPGIHTTQFCNGKACGSMHAEITRVLFLWCARALWHTHRHASCNWMPCSVGYGGEYSVHLCKKSSVGGERKARSALVYPSPGPH